MTELRSKYYRVSIKALVLNDERNKFLIMRQDNGVWDLPGGGLDWGKKIHGELAREIMEEMGIPTTSIAPRPAYFLGGFEMSKEHNLWVVNVVYETELEHLDFIPSDECQEIKFVSLDDLAHLDQSAIPPTVRELAEQFNPENHRRG